VISVLDFLVFFRKESEMEKMLQNGKSLSDLKSSINSAYAVLYEGIALKTPNLSFGDKNLLDQHLEDILIHNRDLVSLLESGFSDEISGYSESFKSIMFNNMCENFLKKSSNISKNLSPILILKPQNVPQASTTQEWRL